MSKDESKFIRLSKLLSQRGLCSRREADRLIEAGQIKVDGQIIDQLGVKVDPGAKVQILSKGQQQLNQKVTILINKPVGFVSSQPEDGYKAAVELITSDSQFQPNLKKFKPAHLKGLAPAGRLDIDSKGLLVLTQDGVTAKKIIGEDNQIEKEYLVWVTGACGDKELRQLRHGLSLDGKKLKKARVDLMADNRLRFILKEGKKRQIRRMCEAVGLKVTSLKRIRIGNVKLGNLPEGQWRFLKKGEDF